jgi:hypothetical protein
MWSNPQPSTLNPEHSPLALGLPPTFGLELEPPLHRLRVGYVMADFRHHVTAHLLQVVRVAPKFVPSAFTKFTCLCTRIRSKPLLHSRFFVPDALNPKSPTLHPRLCLNGTMWTGSRCFAMPSTQTIDRHSGARSWSLSKKITFARCFLARCSPRMLCHQNSF